MSLIAERTTLKGVEKLVAEHRELRDEPLLLAVYYEPERAAGDVFVFEVIEGFGADRVDDDGQLFEASFAWSPSFPLAAGRRLRLVLTNPVEFEVADRDGWPSLQEVQRAVRAGRSVTVYADPSRPDLEAKLGG